MVLLLQLNAELPKQFPTHERRLYVFSCRRKTCRRKEGSIRAIRGVRASADAAPAQKVEERSKKVEREEQKPAVSTGLGESLFGVKGVGSGVAGANPFATGNPFSTGALTGGGGSNPFAKPKPVEEAGATSQPVVAAAAGSAVATAAATATSAVAAVAEKVESAAKALPKTFAETLNINNTQPAAGPAPPPEPWPVEAELPPAYPVAWISDAEYEVLEPTSLPKVPQATSVMDIDSGEGSSSGGAGGKEDKEVFESTMDSTFQKFADRVGQNPDQVIRYEYAGQPLLYAKGDEVSKIFGDGAAGEGKVRSASRAMPRCANCGAGRIFEVQLMPQAIEELESEEDGLDGMDWGTVIVGVCERDCTERGQKTGEAGYLEEWAGVQWEELTMKR
jgi:pre-rRNA-processing protein TSR4